jgi:hypothetical protein
VTAYKNLDHSGIVPVQHQQMIGYHQEQWQSSAYGSSGNLGLDVTSISADALICMV